MEPEPPPAAIYCFSVLSFTLLSTQSISLFILLLILLIAASGLVSGAEVAFFSLTTTDLKELEEEETVSSEQILSLREKPRKLLATILIANNLINIAIVVLSYFIIDHLLPEANMVGYASSLLDTLSVSFIAAATLAKVLYFLITVVGVTAILLLFGEIAPKVYANLNNLKFAKALSGPLTLLNTILGPLSKILVGWSNKLESNMEDSRVGFSSTSKEDLDAAIDLTVKETATSDQEADILKSILKFGDLSVKQIMKPRVDVIALAHNLSFKEVLDIVKEHGYSRMPVYEEDFDKILGILYIKDLIGHSKENKNFEWQKLVRTNVLYVPELKKIDELLKEFQLKRMHLAVVVDEYGGSAGIVTLEDIMEEVIGDIKDEYDEEKELDYVKIADNNYIFEGKILINDMCRVLGTDKEDFDDVRGDSDSIGGLVLELLGVFPKVDKEVKYGAYKFKIISVSNKRIKKINVVNTPEK